MKSKSEYRYLNFKLREDVFLKKKSIGKPTKDLVPMDFKKWVKKFWWNKTSEMHVEEDGKMLEMEDLEIIWHCLYNEK